MVDVELAEFVPPAEARHLDHGEAGIAGGVSQETLEQTAVEGAHRAADEGHRSAQHVHASAQPDPCLIAFAVEDFASDEPGFATCAPKAGQCRRERKGIGHGERRQTGTEHVTDLTSGRLATTIEADEGDGDTGDLRQIEVDSERPTIDHGFSDSIPKRFDAIESDEMIDEVERGT